MKKALISILVGAALCFAFATPALAHGHGGGHHGYSYSNTSSRRYVCNYSGCSRTYNHSHNGVRYYGHHAEDGHDHGWDW